MRVYEFPSTKTDRVYRVIEFENGSYMCSCPGWLFRKDECKHILQIRLYGDVGRKAVVGKEDVNTVIDTGDVIYYPLNYSDVDVLVYKLVKMGGNLRDIELKFRVSVAGCIKRAYRKINLVAI